MTPRAQNGDGNATAFILIVAIVFIAIIVAAFMAMQFQHEQNEKSEAFYDCLNYQMAKYPGNRYAESEAAVGFALEECNKTFGGIY